MSTNHNRIKVADLETNQPNKILKTNVKGELEFSDENTKIETYNALDATTEGKALDARQGKVLKEMIENNTVNIASDSETQIDSPVPEDYKVVSRSKLFNWWDKIKTKTQTIKAVWNFNLGIKVNNSSGSYTYSTEMGEEMLTAKMVSTGYGTIKTEYGWGAVRWFLPNGLYTKISALTPTQNNSIALPDKSGTMAITNDFVKTAAGTTTTPSLIIPNGTLTTVPQNGAIERDQNGVLWETHNGVRSLLTESETPDATATKKGVIKLTGDLEGTADLPKVKGLADKLTATLATDAETQINSAVTEDNKVVSRSKLFNWWEWIKNEAQLISGSWTFLNPIRAGRATSGDQLTTLDQVKNLTTLNEVIKNGNIVTDKDIIFNSAEANASYGKNGFYSAYADGKTINANTSVFGVSDNSGSVKLEPNYIQLAKIVDGDIFRANLMFPFKSGTLATLDDISDISTPDVPVSSTVAGIVDNISLQELGGVDKTIHGVRIGTGNGNGVKNTALGKDALSVNSSSYNTAIGDSTLKVNTSGNVNTAIGDRSMINNTTGSSNTGVGSTALMSNTSANFNTAVGASALKANQYGEQNTAIGAYALYNNVGQNGSNVFGHRSVAIGTSAMINNTTGHGVAVGMSALNKQTTGVWNVAIGTQSGSGITTGSGNVILASEGFIAPGGGINTGSNNLIIAQNNGSTTGITTGSGNTVIGKVNGLATDLSNNIILSDGVGNIRAQHNGTNWTMNTPITATQFRLSALNTAPSSATDTGSVGEIKVDSTYIYICVASNTWKRSLMTTW